MKFDSYHPAINLIFFSSVLFFSFYFTQPVFVLISYTSAFIYSCYNGKVKGLLLNISLIVFMILYILYYSYYNHFGVTNLAINIIGNNITLESVCTGLIRALHISTGCMWFYCMTKIVSSDKIIYLFGKVCPKLSLFLSITLRAIPQIIERFNTVNIAQSSIGLGINQGNVITRIRNFFRVLSIVIMWILESFVDFSISMKSRGYSLKGRTAFSIYRFDNRDRSVVVLMFFCLTIIFMSIALNQGKMQINPHITMNPITRMSYFFYSIYLLFTLMPLILQIISEIKSKYRQA